MATLASLRTAVLQAADEENSNFLGTAEVNAHIVRAAREATAILVEAAEDYYTTPLTFSLTSAVGGNVYSIAGMSTFLKLRALQKQYGSQWSPPLPAFEFDTFGAVEELSYRLIDKSLYVEPREAAAGTYQLWYVYRPAEMVADGDALDDPTGLAEGFVIATAATWCRQKKEDDVATLAMLRQGLEQRVRQMAKNRNQGRAKRVAKIRGAAGFRFMTRSRIPWP